jgi:hypothetical protein
MPARILARGRGPFPARMNREAPRGRETVVALEERRVSRQLGVFIVSLRSQSGTRTVLGIQDGIHHSDKCLRGSVSCSSYVQLLPVCTLLPISVNFLPSFCLHFAFVLPSFCLRFAFVLPSFCLRTTEIFDLFSIQF